MRLGRFALRQQVSGAAHAYVGDVIEDGRCDTARAEEARNLTAVVRGVIHDVQENLPQRIGPRISFEIVIRADALQIRVGKTGNED